MDFLQIKDIIIISLSVIGILTSYFLAVKQGYFKKIILEFTPGKIINPTHDGLITLKRGKKRIPVIAILKFFDYHRSGFRYFSSHIYLTLENRNKYEIEDIVVILTYPRIYFDDKDKHFLASETNDKDDQTIFTLVDDSTVQIKYKLKNIHPFSIRQIMHPLVQPINDFNKALDFDDPYISSVSKKNFSFFKVDISITAKNLKKPIYSNFWVVNVLNQSYGEFFKNEKIFLYDITKQYTYKRIILEIHQIKEYVIGKFKKDALVVKSDHPKVTYSHFRPIDRPYDGQWNFEQEKK